MWQSVAAPERVLKQDNLYISAKTFKVIGSSLFLTVLQVFRHKKKETGQWPIS
jgi:hypothetical protein